jgi:uncharacterized OB-fold protein
LEVRDIMAENVETKKPEKKTIPVEEGLFTMPDAPGGFHLIGGKCKICGAISFPMKKRCIKCYKPGVEAIALSPRGKVSTWTVINMKPIGYKDKVPYILAEVYLPEDLHVRSQIAGDNPEKPTLKIGDQVEAVLEHIYVDENGNDVVCYKYKKV